MVSFREGTLSNSALSFCVFWCCQRGHSKMKYLGLLVQKTVVLPRGLLVDSELMFSMNFVWTTILNIFVPSSNPCLKNQCLLYTELISSHCLSSPWVHHLLRKNYHSLCVKLCDLVGTVMCNSSGTYLSESKQTNVLLYFQTSYSSLKTSPLFCIDSCHC